MSDQVTKWLAGELTTTGEVVLHNRKVLRVFNSDGTPFQFGLGDSAIFGLIALYAAKFGSLEKALDLLELKIEFPEWAK